MKKLLVLGATGFIGRNMAEAFAVRPDFEVYGTYFESLPLDSPEIHMVRADLTKSNEVYRVVEGMDIVIQAAAVTAGIKDVAENPHTYIADNAVMNSLIFRAAYDCSVEHVILLSCTVMYHSSDTPLKEGDFDANREMYPSYFGGAWNKVYFEKMCEFYSRLGRNKYTAFRHSNVYGPFDKFDLDKSHVFGATMTKVMTAENGAITVWGDGEEGRDLLYVDDLVQCVDLAIARQQTPYELFNVGYGRAVRIKDLVQMIIDCSGKPLAIEFDLDKPSNKTFLSLDCTKAREVLGWSPSTNIEEGIGLTMQWYEAYHNGQGG
jgi:GDP-L-fucose synthase